MSTLLETSSGYCTKCSTEATKYKVKYKVHCYLDVFAACTRNTRILSENPLRKTRWSWVLLLPGTQYGHSRIVHIETNCTSDSVRKHIGAHCLVTLPNGTDTGLAQHHACTLVKRYDMDSTTVPILTATITHCGYAWTWGILASTTMLTKDLTINEQGDPLHGP